MNDRAFDQLLDAWMDLGPTAAPERVANAARLEARTTRQTAIPIWWPPRRFLEMNNATRIVVAAAAFVAAAVLGYAYLAAPNVGGPNLPDPTSEPSPTPDAAALIQGSGLLMPGRYVITQVPPLRITITVPEGWESLFVPAVVWSTDSGAALAVLSAHDVYADPCDPAAGLVGIGPTVDDLVEALADHPAVSIDSETQVSISGYSGTRLDITGSDPGCSGAVEPLLFEAGSVDRPLPAAGEASSLNIVDVDGRRLLINARLLTGDGADVAAEIESMIESIVIEAP